MAKSENGINELVAAIGGLPFTGKGFRPGFLLSMVAGVRQRFDPDAYPRLEDYLDPLNARQIFDRFSRTKATEPSHEAVSNTENAKIDQACQQVVAVRPEWEALLSIPVLFRKIEDERISMTTALVPQVIFFGEAAFADDEVLAELVVHEFSHIWLNFIAEIADLQTNDARPEYTLPSGTGGKPVRGVLLAAHFAAAAHAYHMARDRFPDRADYLHDYLSKCIATISAAPHITPMGYWVLKELNAYREKINAFDTNEE